MSHSDEIARNAGIELAYNGLAKSVVLNAVTEYKGVRKRIRYEVATEGKPSIGLIKKRRELEEFFDSDWCDQLCGFDGTEIKRRLRRE